MTDNEIVKALECCATVPAGGCVKKKCPMIVECEIDIKALEKQALDLINRQKAEIENLQKVAETQQSLAVERHFEIERLKAEIERLKKNPTIPKSGFLNLLCGAVIYTETLEEYNKFRKQIKATARAEAIKEFAERLKEKVRGEGKYSAYFRWVIVDDMDNLVKEMVGESG